MTTAFAFAEAPEHIYRDHPESPRRFEVLRPRLDAVGAERLPVSPASPEEIARVHQPALIKELEAVCKQGDSIIDFAPTFVTRTSFEDARLAAGATLSCERAVLAGAARNAFAIVRPPGHHAEPDRAMGFCLFNNIAVAAKDALSQGLRHVAIVDYDAHHGNGTQAAFKDEERVAYLSMHQWGIYPGTGWYAEAEHARKRIVNVPLPSGSGNQVYEQVADDILEPFIRGFKPELILVSAGFDAHWSDPLTSLGLSSAGFYELSKRLVDLADETSRGKIVFVLEGGYDPTNLANGVQAAFAALIGNDFVDLQDAFPHAEPDANERLAAVRKQHGF